MKTKTTKIAIATGAILLTAWILPPVMHKVRRLCPLRPSAVPQAQALPQFARRYGFECSVCHSPSVPRLNQFGYNFRRAGFRIPDEYGQEAKFNGLKDIFGSKFVAQYQVTAAATDGSITNEKVPSAHSFQVPQVSLYPFSGAFGQYWATRGEFTFHVGEQTEVENAYVRATYPYKDFIFYARAGIMHPYEGFGASDESLGNFDPLFMSNSAKDGTFDSMVMLMGQNQLGGEVGVGYNNTTASLAVWNGFNTKTNAANQGANNNHYDLRLFINQMLGEKAAASVEYINGKTDWGDGGMTPADASVTADPVTGAPVANPAVPATWVNNYQRLAAFANYALLGEKLNILGGYELGKDHRPDAVPGGKNNTDSFNSNGWFAEAQSKICKRFVAGLRGEIFRPSTRTGANLQSAVTATGVVPFDNFKFTVDYQVKRMQSAVGKDRTDNTLLAEWMLAF